MATIQVVDANGGTQTVQEPAAPGQAAAAASKPVVLATDDPLVTVTGAKTDAANAATDTTSISIMSVLKQISKSIQGTLTVATHAVTQSGAWVLSAGSALIGIVKIGDGTTTVSLGTYGTAPGAVAALNVNANVTNALSPGRQTVANSSPVVLAKQDYQDLAASTASTAIKGQSGTTGAAGDWLDFVLIIPETTAAGTVTLQDGTNAAIDIFVSGTLGSLVPFTVPIRAVSASGAWQISTGAAVHVRAVGNFT